MVAATKLRQIQIQLPKKQNCGLIPWPESVLLIIEVSVAGTFPIIRFSIRLEANSGPTFDGCFMPTTTTRMIVTATSLFPRKGVTYCKLRKPEKCCKLNQNRTRYFKSGRKCTNRYTIPCPFILERRMPEQF